MTTNPPASQTPPPPRPAWRRLVRAGMIFVVVPYLGVVLLFTLAQRQMLYHPHRTPPLRAAEYGFGAGRDISIATPDGLTLHGWWLAAATPTGVQTHAPEAEAAAGSAPLLVIYFPGNASNRAGRTRDLRDFTRLGCEVLIVDYRGYADNDGAPTETALTADARAVWEYALADLQADAGRIVLFGESLGGAVAIDLAADLCRDGTPPAAVITNATFDSIPNLATTLYPLLPLRWLVWDRWNSLEAIGQFTCPVLMFHGSDDTLIPVGNGRRLFAAAPSRSEGGIEKRLVEISGAGHNDVPVSLLQEEVRRLLDRLHSDASEPTTRTTD